MKELLVKNRRGFILYTLGALITALNGILESVALATGFSIYEATTRQEVIWRALVTLALGLSPILLQYLSRMLRIGFMRDVLTEVRLLAYQKIMKTPIEEFRNKKREDYVANLVSDINVFESDFFLAILNIIYSYGSFLIGEIILFFISPLIAGLVLLISVIIFLFTKLFENPIRRNIERNQEANARYTEQVANILGGLEVIKLYQVEDRFRPRFHSIVARLERVKRRTNFLQSSQGYIIEWIGTMSQVGLFIIATYQFIEGSMTLSSMILVFTFSGQMIWANVSGASMINRLSGSMDIFHRITDQPVWASGREPYRLDHGITVRNLTFSYGEDTVLSELNLTIQKGDKVLIYGPSGTGKTTLLNCLTKNLTSYEGEILIDNAELRTIDYESMLDSSGYIRQQHFLFEDTIQDNIVLDQPLDVARLEQVLKDVALWDWIQSLERGTGQLLSGNGSNISGGQRQRISIARELYRNPAILAVDEPSASLDDETAALLYDTLLNHDRTLILVSHRHLNYLSQRVDQVIRFDGKGDVHVQKA